MAEPKIKEVTITSEMKKVIDTLSDNEKTIIYLPRYSLSGIINALKRKNILKKREYGRTNVIEISQWFLSEKEL